MKGLKSITKDTKSRAIFVVILVIILIAAGIGYWFFRSTNQGVEAGAQLRGAPSIGSIPGVGTPSREYVKTQQEENVLQAEEAERTGKSAIPTITSTSYLGPSEFQQPSAAGAAKEGCSAEELTRARAAGVKAEELRCKGCTAAQLRAAGYTAGELMAAGFSAKELKDAGFNAAELRAAGFTAAELARAGFSTDDLVAAGFSTGELTLAGMIKPQPPTAVSKLPKDCSQAELAKARQNGVSAIEIRANKGCNASQFKTGGFGAAELKTAGFSAAELKDAGFSCGELKNVGFTVGELRLAGCSAAELAQLGFSTAELRDAGFGADELKDAGFTSAQLKTAGFSNGELLRAGFSQDQIYPQQPAQVAAAAPQVPAAAPVVEQPAESTTLPPIDSDQDAASAAALERLQARQAQQLNEQERQELLQQMQTAMASQANELFASWSPPPTQQYVRAPEEKEQAQEGGGQVKGAVAATTPGQQGGAAQASGNIIKAGSVLYATLDTSINSDEQSPILATIVQGPYQGAKLVGSFERRNKKVVLSFNLMNVPNLPNSVSINAVAIDPNTARTALASDVNSHYLLRYGTLFASAFATGLADAITQSGSTQVVAPGIAVTSTPPLDTGQKAMVALGQVGTQYGQVLGSNFTTPPTVKVDAGSGIGILFMQDATIPNAPSAS